MSDDLDDLDAAYEAAMSERVIGTHIDDSDLANARRIVTIADGKILHARGLGWLSWTGTHWDDNGDSGAVQLAGTLSGIILGEARAAQALADRTTGTEAQRNEAAVKRLRKWAHASEGRQRVAHALDLARAWLEVDLDQIDADPWLLNLQNGTLDLRTGQLREHRPADLITKCAPVRLDPSATAPEWRRFLARVLPSDTLRSYVQRLAGYCMTGSVEEQSLHFLHGPGGNGKSTLLAAIEGTLGSSYVKRAPSDLLTAANGERHPTEIMTVRGARLVICTETEQGRMWATERVKQLTGEERVSGRRMRQDFVEFRLTAKLVVMSNHKPHLPEHNEAFWRRMRLVPFDVTIPRAEHDKALLAKLAAERPGILNWMIDGLAEWRADGLGMAPEVEAAVWRYRSDTDSVTRFVTECCYRVDAARVRPGDLHEAYLAWCRSTEVRSVTPQQFASRLLDDGFGQVRVDGYQYWTGIGLPTGERGGGYEH